MAANQVDFKILPSDQFSVYSPQTRSDKVITYFTLLSKLRGDILSVGQDDDPNDIVSAFYSSVGGNSDPPPCKGGWVGGYGLRPRAYRRNGYLCRPNSKHRHKRQRRTNHHLRKYYGNQHRTRSGGGVDWRRDNLNQRNVPKLYHHKQRPVCRNGNICWPYDASGFLC
jgi:hypothetical protein